MRESTILCLHYWVLFFLVCRLYGDPSNRPKYNLLFVLSGGGKFNYFGTKGLLEDQLEDSPLLPSADYTLCLDSLLKPDHSEGLYLHVSKPPKEGSKAYGIVQALNQVCAVDLCMVCVAVSMSSKRDRLAYGIVQALSQVYAIGLCMMCVCIRGLVQALSQVYAIGLCVVCVHRGLMAEFRPSTRCMR